VALRLSAIYSSRWRGGAGEKQPHPVWTFGRVTRLPANRSKVASAIGWRAGEAYARITLGGALLRSGSTHTP
jgi:hypothetical protein